MSELSRQHKWSRKQADEGRCGSCGKTAEGLFCVDCRQKRRDRDRNRYRMAKGIPIDAVVTKGRPRAT